MRRLLARPRARDALALAVIVLGWAGFYWRYLPLGLPAADALVFPNGDFWQHFYVYRNFAFETLRDGRFPLWMPCIFSGYPYQADPQSALFYPSTLLNFGLWIALGARELPRAAFQSEALLHVLLAGVLMYAFLRGEVRRRSAALIGALVFAFGGYMTGYPPLQLAVLQSAAWLPLGLLFLRRVVRRGRVRDVALLGLTWGVMLLAGHPQTAMFVLYASLAYGAWRLAELPAGRARALMHVGLALVLALAVAAVQLLPSLEYMRLSTRAAIPYEEAATGFPLQDVLQFIVPGFVSEWQPLYVGLLPLALAAFALLAWRRGQRRDVWFWLALALAGLILAFGQHAFGYDLAYWLAPGYRVFRSQERHALWVALALAALAAHGADRLFGPLSRDGRRAARALGWGLAGAALLLFVTLAVVTYLKRVGIDPSDRGRLPALVGMAFFVMLLAAALWAARVRGARPWPLPALAVALLAFDLLSAGRGTNAAVPGPLYPADEALQPMLDARAAGEFFRVQEDGLLEMHTLCSAGLDELGGASPIQPAGYQRFMERAPEAVRWDVLDVAFLLSRREELRTRQGQPVDGQQVYADGEGAVFRATYRLGRAARQAWLVYDVLDAGSQDDLYAMLEAPNFDAYATAVVREAHGAPGDPGSLRGVATVVDRQPGRLLIDVDAPANALLVVSESAYPGWAAAVDGAPVPVLTVDDAVLGAGVPAGRHQVSLEYRPPTFVAGATVSAGALVLVLLALLVRERRP